MHDKFSPIMLILGINTAIAKTALTLIKNGDGYKTVFLREWESNRDEAEKLLPQIKAALKNGHPDKIFVVAGPGAFTGLRIGVTAANTLAYAFNAPVTSCSTFDFLIASIPEELRKKTVIILRAGGEFVAAKVPSSKKAERIGKNELERFFSSRKSIEFAVSDMSAEEKKKCVLPKKIKWIPEKTIRPFDEVVATLIESGKNPSAKMIAPQYLLPPKITVSKKEIFT